MPDVRFALVGQGISQSLSPRLHRAIGTRLGMTVEYDLLDVDTSQIHRCLADLQSGRWDGLNVTTPHKILVADSVKRLDAVAARVKAVNTVGCSDGTLWGANTDGFGFEYLLGQLRPSHVLVLGAGGASRVVCKRFEAMPSTSVYVANRTRARAEALLHESQTAQILTFTDALHRLDRFDCVVNCLPGHARAFFDGQSFQALPSTTWFIDLAYGDTARVFRNRHLPLHRRYRDGLAMLVAQGVRSFEMWTGHQIDPKDISSILSSLEMDEDHN